MQAQSTDTIAAIATPAGHGGIAIIRVSGAQARQVLLAVFRSPVVGFTPKPRYMHFGHLLDASGHVLDEGLAVYMPGPHSATGEDVAELHCHGGPGVAMAVLEAACAQGVRLATAGEFTRRAFLNGRMNLTQAEAVAEMIGAPTAEGARLAAAKLSGVFGEKIVAIRAGLDALRIQLTLAVDFPDDEAELLDPAMFQRTVTEALEAMQGLLLAYERARLWREGASVVLAGCVNAGKSSLFNSLLGRHRAIVSAMPGTTRDYIEESINLGGLPVRLLDTAGLRAGEDVVEMEGIALSRSLAEQADVIVLVADASKHDFTEEQSFVQQYAAQAAAGSLLVVLNKQELAATPPDPALWQGCPVFGVSAKTGQGLDALAQGIALAARARGGTVPGELAEGDIAPNLRQSALLREAREGLLAFQRDLPTGLPPDILSVHLDGVIHALDDVTGNASQEELLDRIFSSFCIGK